MQTYAAIIALVGVLGVECVVAPSPHRVESRQSATKPWTTYEAFSVDRIPGFTPSPDPALDEYGGWLGTHVGNPDGFFRVRKIDGRMREINACTYNLSRFHEKFSRISSGGRDL